MKADIRKVRGTGSDEKLTGWFVDGSHDWDSFLLQPMNWRNFTLIHLAGEWNHMSGRVEVELALIGLHLRITYVYDDTFAREMQTRVDEIRAQADVVDEGEEWKRNS